MEEIINQLFTNSATPQVKEWLEALMSTTTKSTVNIVLESLNWVFLACGLALAIWHFATQAFSASASGETGPAEAHYWGWLRTVIGLLFLAPVSFGLSTIQLIVLMIALAGSNLAQIGWSAVVDEFYSDKSVSSTEFMPPPYETVEGIMKSQICYLYVKLDENSEQTFQMYEGINFVGSTRYTGPYSYIPDNKCGEVEYPDLSEMYDYSTSQTLEGIAQKYEQEIHASIEQLERKLFPLSLNIARIINPGSRALMVKSNLISTNIQQELTSEKYSLPLYNAIETYQTNIKTAYSQLIQSSQKDVEQNNLSSQKEAEWVFAGGYYRRISDITYTLGQMSKAVNPTISPPEWEELYQKQDYDVNQGRKSFGEWYETSLNNWKNFKGKYVSSTNNTLVSTSQGGAQPDQKTASFSISKILREVLAGLAVDYGDADYQDMHPFAKIADLGLRFEIAAYGLLLAVAGAGLIPFVGSAVGAIEGVTGFLFQLLFISGAIFSTVFPLIPYFLFSVGLAGWFVAIITFLLFSPLWVMGNINMTSKAPIIGTAWTNAVHIFFTPIILIILSILGLELFSLASSYIVMGFSKSFDVAISDSGIFAPILYALMFGLFHVVAAYFCFSPLLTMPQKITEYISGNGD